MLHWNQRVLLTRYIQPKFPDGIYKYNLDDNDTFLKHLHPQGARIIGGWLGSVDPPISQTVAFAVVDAQRCAVQWLILSGPQQLALHPSICNYMRCFCLSPDPTSMHVNVVIIQVMDMLASKNPHTLVQRL